MKEAYPPEPAKHRTQDNMFPKDLHLFTYVKSANGYLPFFQAGPQGQAMLDITSSKVRSLEALLFRNTTLRRVHDHANKWNTDPQISRYHLSLRGKNQESIPAVLFSRIIENGEQGVAALAHTRPDGGTLLTDCLPDLDPWSLGPQGADYLFSLAAMRLHGGVWAATLASEKSLAVQIDTITERLVDLFDRELRYVPSHDEWHLGRVPFAESVRFFVVRNLPLHFALPAFPCKSGNDVDKTLGTLPDMGELLALRSLDRFNQLVKQIYPPGSVIVIVSDGHVFSDLIGVADETVNVYGQVLRDQASSHFAPGTVLFHGLEDLLSITPLEPFSASPGELRRFFPDLSSVPVSRFLLSDRSADAEDARRVLGGLFGSDGSVLKSKTKNDPDVTALYRGFSKFLLTDLANNRIMLSLSRTQQKKRCSAVALEMIQRNDAYSAMIELLFPMHIRISIHPHSCAGPKYGIRLAHSSFLGAKVVDDQSSETLFHIPTPWHNTVLECPPGTYTFVKRAAIRAAEENGKRVELVLLSDGRPSHYKMIEDGATMSQDQTPCPPVMMLVEPCT
ncbi:Pyoverdine/dityrosine biosynthesis protein-domain-containing protein [Powellomyces hirtus]|nr:Pyoverdine/dityrosine biosynthesis protein-domain-containing protein [Powellomyces hirtus]